ncbi:MAG: glucokinase [Scytonema sp. PMC 1069.18]|nr:glucokinase [Scytonema sp. PMC 1069.18]MEC4881609.1 glucokinase [Scytonema sp. PMC 1070.18]
MLLLVGDNGGTNTRLRLVKASSQEKKWTILHHEEYDSRKYRSLVPMVKDFLTSAKKNNLDEELKPKKACFALAGPIEDHTICKKISNLDWSLLDARDLEQVLDIDQVSLLNDFEAIGYGILGLNVSDSKDVFILQKGTSKAKAPIGVLGAGTGLGTAYLTWEGSSYTVNSSEGGHSDYAPHSCQTTKLLMYLQDKYEQEKIHIEEIISGRGIVAIYQFLRDKKEFGESPEIAQAVEIWKQDKSLVDAPAIIATEGNKEEGDRLCRNTMALFFEAYGAEAGNVALTLLSNGGFYIAGGIAPKNLGLITQGGFMKAFSDKNKMKSILKNIPVYIITTPEIGLIGATIYASQM